MNLKYYGLGTLAATFTLYLWGAAMHLGVHTAVQAIPVLDEAVETQIITALQDPAVAIPDGIHMGGRGLFLIVSTLDEGTDTFSGLSFPGTLTAQLLVCMLVGGLLSIIVLRVRATSILGTAADVTLIAVAAASFTCLPQWCWYGFGPKFTAVNMLDIVGGWFFSALVLAWLARRLAPPSSGAPAAA
jgi:hypothetical protein